MYRWYIQHVKKGACYINRLKKDEEEKKKKERIGVLEKSRKIKNIRQHTHKHNRTRSTEKRGKKKKGKQTTRRS